MRAGAKLTGFLVCASLCWTISARADAVVDWNDITLQAVLNSGAARPGATGLLDIAMIHAAVYDAVEAIDKQFRPYHFDWSHASGSTTAAAAKAAHDVLIARFPEQAASLDAAYHDYLSKNHVSEADAGVIVGQGAAAAIIALRAHDGGFPNPAPSPFLGGDEPGVWRPTTSYLPGPPPSMSPMLVPWLADVTPFTLTRAWKGFGSIATKEPCSTTCGSG